MIIVVVGHAVPVPVPHAPRLTPLPIPSVVLVLAPFSLSFLICFPFLFPCSFLFAPHHHRSCSSLPFWVVLDCFLYCSLSRPHPPILPSAHDAPRFFALSSRMTLCTM